MKNGSGTRGSITAVTRAALAISLDLVLLVGSENNSTTGVGTGLAKHAEILKLITLFAFGFVPEGPSGKGFELTAGKIAESKFFQGGGMGRNGMDEEVDVFVTDQGRVRGRGIT